MTRRGAGHDVMGGMRRGGSGKDAVCVRSVFIAASIQTIERNPC